MTVMGNRLDPAQPTNPFEPRPRFCPVCGTQLRPTMRRDAIFDRKSCRDVAYRERLRLGEVTPRRQDRPSERQEPRPGRLVRL